MRFHAILFVRDEGDIIRQSLEHNCKWADQIYVFDTGSTDETWETVLECSHVLRQIIPFRKQAVWFHDNLRAMVFNEFRGGSDEGDWWVRLDADEFYHVSPREFVKTLASHETAIYHAYYNFRLTREEIAACKTREDVLADRSRPMAERRRFYQLGFGYSEPRFFRYRRSMRWPMNTYGPYNAGFASPRRIPIRHYQERDSLQLAVRYRLRHAMMSPGAPFYDSCVNDLHHWKNENWTVQLVSQTDPTLLHWDGCSPLPACTAVNHIARGWRRSAQRLAHAALLPILDRCRPSYAVGSTPSALPDDVQQRLSEISR